MLSGKKTYAGMKKVKKVVLIGSESTGKTELAEYLSEKYRTLYIPEFARSYIENLSRPYTYDDVNRIAQIQVDAEKNYVLKANELLFYDTYLIVTKVWFSHVFGHVPDWIDESLKSSDIDLFLLCNNDIPWKYDPARENPHLREYLFDIYKSELEKYNFNFRIVSGQGEKRINLAEVFVDELLNEFHLY
jgi:NadR type nicotinamide-nucleotide adenylyltransferase